MCVRFLRRFRLTCVAASSSSGAIVSDPWWSLIAAMYMCVLFAQVPPDVCCAGSTTRRCSAARAGCSSKAGSWICGGRVSGPGAARRRQRCDSLASVTLQCCCSPVSTARAGGSSHAGGWVCRGWVPGHAAARRRLRRDSLASVTLQCCWLQRQSRRLTIQGLSIWGWGSKAVPLLAGEHSRVPCVSDARMVCLLTSGPPGGSCVILFIVTRRAYGRWCG